MNRPSRPARAPARFQYRLIALAVAFCAVFGQLQSARAQAGPSEATLSTAREVAKQGLAAYDAGRYEEAAEKLLQAYEAVKLPTLALYAARSLEKMGRLVKSAELYLEATRLKPDESWQEGQRQAQDDAKAEREALVPRIPRLTIRLENAKPSEISVTIDGATVPRSLVLAEQFVDPGTRRVVGQRGDEQVTEQVTLAEGAKQSVLLSFQPQATSSAAPSGQTKPAAEMPPGLLSEAVDQGSGTKSSSGLQGVLGWTALSLGGAGLALGAGTGIWVLSKKGTLEDQGCDGDGHCYSDQQTDVDSFNTMRGVSTVGFIAGGVLAATGLTLLFTRPKPKEAPPELAFRVGPGSMSVTGSF